MTYGFLWSSLIVTLIYLLFIAGIIFTVVYVIKLMKERNSYLKDIRDELRKRYG